MNEKTNIADDERGESPQNLALDPYAPMASELENLPTAPSLGGDPEGDASIQSVREALQFIPEEPGVAFVYRGISDYKAETKSERRSANRSTIAELDRLRVKQARNERMVFSGAIMFVIAVVIVVIFSNGTTRDGAVNIIRRVSRGAISTNNYNLQCADEKNKNTPYCLGRWAETEASWRGIERFEKGEAPPFALHEKNSAPTRPKVIPNQH